MADDTAGKSDSKFSGFTKTAGGIVASVITAVLIYYLTRPPAPPLPKPQFGLNGVVADVDSHNLIRNASVTVALGPNSANQITDSLGRYSVVLLSLSSDAIMGNVEIQATGYRSYKNTVALHPGDNYAEIEIEPDVPPAKTDTPPLAGQPVPVQPTQAQPPPASPTNSATALHNMRAQIILKAPPPNYIKKEATVYVGIPHN